MPAAPTNLVATAGNGQVSLSWSAVSAAASYNIYQGTSSGGEIKPLITAVQNSAGLGWHGLHCVFGPVHRNLLPIDAALSVIAAATATALEHVVRWMRRTLQRLASVAPYIGPGPVASPVATPAPRVRPRPAAGGARAPPCLS